MIYNTIVSFVTLLFVTAKFTIDNFFNVPKHLKGEYIGLTLSKPTFPAYIEFADGKNVSRYLFSKILLSLHTIFSLSHHSPLCHRSCEASTRASHTHIKVCRISSFNLLGKKEFRNSLISHLPRIFITRLSST